MTIGEFSQGDSFLHRLDPRVKVVVAAVFSVEVALEHSIAASFAALVLSAGVLTAARVPFMSVLQRLENEMPWF